MTSGELVEGRAESVLVFPFVSVSRTCTGNSFAGATNLRLKSTKKEEEVHQHAGVWQLQVAGQGHEKLPLLVRRGWLLGFLLFANVVAVCTPCALLERAVPFVSNVPLCPCSIVQRVERRLDHLSM